MKAASKVFVDSSAWVALFCKEDGRHERAVEHWQRLRDDRRLLLTSDYVLDET